MKGLIILPKFFEQRWKPKLISGSLDFEGILNSNALLYYSISNHLDFDLIYADEVNVDSDVDVVFMFGVPYHNRPKLIPGLLDLNKKVKLVMWPGDLQCYDNKLCLENRIKVFERCDVILSPVYEYFEKNYPQFIYKHEFFPKFFASDERYTRLPFNNTPKMRCLLSGAVNPHVYPLRNVIRKNDIVDYRSSKYVAGNAYAKLLNSYFCCAASSSIFNYAVAKYFEIPAAGSLLIANETNDLKRIGFVPHQHYVPITKANAIKTIKRCIENPNDYNDIRKKGMEYVRNNHSIVNRIERLKLLFKELFNK